MKELNKCYLIDNKYIIINYTSSKKNKYDRKEDDEAVRGLSSSFSLQYLRRCDEWYNI